MTDKRSNPSFLAACALLASSSTAIVATPAPAMAAGLTPITTSDWGQHHVRRVLGAFAFGGHASDRQVRRWSQLSARDAVDQMLTFDTNNALLSAPEDESARRCGSIAALQDFWGSDAPDNPMRYSERYRLKSLGNRDALSASAFQRTWAKAVGTRGCNPFVHKTALFLTNYHAAVTGADVEWALVRAYYDDMLAALARSGDFADLMHVAASHAAIARQYSHQYNRVSSSGKFYGNDDFAREFFQLLFGINGDSETPEHHENVTIEQNARLLTGMNIDRERGAYGAVSRTEFVSPIDFSDHIDATGRDLPNTSHHPSRCLKILHADICGDNADEKLAQLTRHAVMHDESLAALPLAIAGWFGNDRITRAQERELREGWEAARGDLLEFLRAYAASSAFHAVGNVKFKSVFDRVLTLQNAHIASNAEVYARKASESPRSRIEEYGIELFEPLRSIFGHQTGLDAANDRYVFKQALMNLIEDADYFYEADAEYDLSPGGDTVRWEKDWATKVPSDKSGRHRVSRVATWLWKHYIGDEGRNFDRHARLQVHSLLSAGTDFMLALKPDDHTQPMTRQLLRTAEARRLMRAQRRDYMDLESDDGKRRIGLAVNFIAMMPFTFAMGGDQ